MLTKINATNWISANGMEMSLIAQIQTLQWMLDNVVLHQLLTQLLELLTNHLPLEVPLLQPVGNFTHSGTPSNVSGHAQSCQPLLQIPVLTLQLI
jgi:hypothetical protein